MRDTIRLNLHCHSHHSDGELSPDELAERLAAAGVRAAALTDHDTIDGGAEFRRALARRGIGVISGVELTAAGPQGGEVHLLGYGFDPAHPDLQALLTRVNAPRRTGTWPMRGPAAGRQPDRDGRPAGKPVAAEAVIRILHEAGGLVFLAHPVLPDEPVDQAVLDTLLRRLKDIGLDGVEAYCPNFPPGASEALTALADAHGLLVSGGSDYHGTDRAGSMQLALDIPVDRWRRFRDALLRSRSEVRAAAPDPEAPGRRAVPRHRRSSFLLRIVLPTLLAIGLFVVAMFRVIIPAFEARLLDRKRDTIREVTNVAVGILAEYDAESRQGRLPPDEARRAAAERIRELRYGVEGKDYFWIQDLHPRMVMHPYRSDLDGTDLNGFQDPRGARIFVEFVNALRDREDGYVEYVWQWQDDPGRLEPKQSFIKKFAPWGWIIGTGLYLDDVQREIRVLAARLTRMSAGIAALCSLLLGFVALQSMRIERRRRTAEDELRESHEKYRTLAESVTEGTLMVLEGRPTFANPKMLEMLGYAEDELALLDLADLFFDDGPDGAGGPGPAAALAAGGELPRFIETGLRTRGGGRIEAALTATRVAVAGRDGFVLAVRDIGGVAVRSPAVRRYDIERESLIGELQASLMFLHEPVAPLAWEPLFLDLKEPVSRAAALMTSRGVGAVVVTADGVPVGIVTDSDLRARVLAPKLDGGRPLFEVMSSPLVTIEAGALTYEAILAMRERNVDHMPVRDESGRVTGVLHNRELLLFHRYSLAVVTQEIRHADSVDAIARARRGLPKLVKALVDGGAKARNITRAVTSVTDAVAVRLVELALREFGDPPVRFALIALGSQGRQEQTLVTDQDHALIFEDVPEAAEEEARTRLLRIGAFLSEGMAAAGYPLCQGRIMADNPRWCRPLAAWKRTFADWLRTAEPQDVLELRIFFDFRTVFGPAEFAAALRRHIDETLRQEPPFLLHYARSSQQHKVPVGFFGHLVLGSGREGARTLDLKDALLPLSDFARLYAFRHGVQETNTLDRLRALLELGQIKASLHDETVKVYDLLMQLRLARQARAADQGLAPDNEIDPKALTHLEETSLKEAFAQIGILQKKIGYDFLGAA